MRITRLISLATQKFIRRSLTTPGSAQRYRAKDELAEKRERASTKDKRVVLTMEDLSAALGEYGAT